MVPRAQALATLRRGFELGVNLVHTAADYGGAMEIVAEASREAPHPVYVCSNGWGAMAEFEARFERSLELFGRRGRDGRLRLELYGIASVEDRLVLGDDVWGEQGQVAFLQRKQREGVLGHLFCTTHASPAFIANLIRGGAFDAVMFAYNALGHHALSFLPLPGHEREDVAGNGALIQLAAEHDVGVLLMEVLGGGLMVPGRAFEDRVQRCARASPRHAPALPAARILGQLLQAQPQAASLLPGTASVEEAEENALAGHASTQQGDVAGLEPLLAALRTTSCTRCGACEPLCSRQLPCRGCSVPPTSSAWVRCPSKHRPARTTSTCIRNRRKPPAAAARSAVAVARPASTSRATGGAPRRHDGLARAQGHARRAPHDRGERGLAMGGGTAVTVAQRRHGAGRRAQHRLARLAPGRRAGAREPARAPSPRRARARADRR
jgi:predicted aldo/keto reductase-like oxidoreductase